MPITQLNHVNVRTNQLDTMIDWYTTVLGLRQGDRPRFPFAGAWLYAGDTAVVHLVAVDQKPGAGAEQALKLEHFAFSASDADSFEATLIRTGSRFEKSHIQAINLVLYNVWDPDGNHIHVDFPADE